MTNQDFLNFFLYTCFDPEKSQILILRQKKNHTGKVNRFLEGLIRYIA